MTGALATFGETMALLTSATEGPLRHTHALTLDVAGSESNVAIGVRRLGADSCWFGRVGDDEFGQLVLSRLRGERVEVGAATTDDEAPTGLMVKERRTSRATRVLYYRRGSAASRMRPDHLPEARIRAAGVLHVTGITAALSASARETVLAAIDIASGAGVPVSLDLNYRAALWPPDEAGRVLRDLVGRAQIVFAGEDEAALVCDDEDPERWVAALGAGGKDVMVKRGPRGAVAVVGGQLRQVPPVPVESRDPVGAGDGFAAGYLAGLLAGDEAEARLRLAATVGAFAVTVQGDWQGLPCRSELPLLSAAEDVIR